METVTIQKQNAADFVKVGETLETSWGYDQTNVEFFKVIKIIGKRYFLVQELKAETKETGFMCGLTLPTNEFKGEPVKAFYDGKRHMHLCEDGGYQRSLFKWDGTPSRASWYA